MIRPVDYKQYDTKWATTPYAVDGEKSTIKSAGCGPTSMANVLASLVNSYIDPVTMASWARMKGYKYKGQGTAHSFFVAAGKAYGVNVRYILSSYHNPNHSSHNTIKNELLKGNWVIALMGKGLWTSAGHYITVYGYYNGNVYINDPNSTKANRACNSFDVFKNEVKAYWIIEVPESVKKSGKCNPSNEYKEIDFVREVQLTLGAGLDGIAGRQTLGKTITVSKKYNKNHNIVYILEKKMKYLGLYDKALDKSFGTGMDTAIRNFQSKYLAYPKPDGEATKGGKTWKKILGLPT